MTRMTTKATAAPATAPVRTRQRPEPKAAAVVTRITEATKPKATKSMKAKVEEFVRENAKMNEGKRLSDKAKKLLWPEMSDAGFVLGDGGFIHEVNGKPYCAAIQQPDKQDVDVRKLFVALGGDLKALEAIPGADVFLKIVSATQQRVTDEVGKNVLNQSLVTVPGTLALLIKEVK